MCFDKLGPANSNKRTVCLVATMILYLLAGAGVCYLLEAPVERHLQDHIRGVRELFKKANLCIPGWYYNFIFVCMQLN